MREDSLELFRAFGLANLEHDLPITSASRFMVASLSKQFTAMAIGLLAEDGALGLDDPVGKHLPELPDYGAVITVRNLLNHTSGVRDYSALMGMAGGRTENAESDRLVRDIILAQRKLNFPPGSRFLYSNSNYFLLAWIVERVSGRPVAEFAARRVFGPLGMSSTVFADGAVAVIPDRVSGYRRAGETWRLSNGYNTVGPGSLWTTVGDLARWDGNFYRRAVGGRSALDDLTRPGMAGARAITYAAGLIVKPYRDFVTVSHPGNSGGFSSELLRFPQLHLSVAVLCNAGDANAEGLARRVAHEYLPPPAPRTEPAVVFVDLPESLLASRVGAYRAVDRGATPQLIELTLDQGQLWVDAGGAFRIAPLAANRFRSVDEPEPVDLEFTASGTPPAARLVVHVTGETEPHIFAPVRLVHPTQEELAGYAGRYRSAELETVYQLDVVGDTLRLARRGSAPATLLPMGADEFRVLDPFIASVRFVRSRDGRIEALRADAGRALNVEFRRVP